MKSKAYWVKRAVEVETYLQSQADSIKDGVIKAYERAIKNVNNDIEKTFKAYISTDIPEKEARRLMSIADSDKQYEELLELYDETDDKTVKKEILNRINAQAYGARISRLEGLKRNVYIYFRHVANEAIKEQKKLYDSAVKTAYYTNIFDTAQGLNCGIDFSLIPQRAVNMVLSEPWHGHNYSDRVWIHNDRFIQAVGQTIEDGIISGHSVSRMTDKLIDYVKDTAPGGIRTSAETLVRSETAHFMNQGQRMAYEEIGIKQYRFVAALSELTCDTCGSLDGSVFDTDKAVEGENFPPIHPRCRCVTVMADVNLSTRIARDPLTGENCKVDGSMTFNEWKNGLSDEQKNALKYVANAEKRGIIKVKNAANSATRNTGRELRYDSSKDFSIKLDGYSVKINDSLSNAICEVTKLGGADGNEYMRLVDLKTGTHSYNEDEGEKSSTSVGGKDFWDYIKSHSDNKFAFVHNHNTDGCFSETDMKTLLTCDNIDIFIAARIDGVIYVAEKNKKYIGNGIFDPLYKEDLEEINKLSRVGEITAGERTHMREETIVNNLLKDYTKGLEVYVNGKKQVGDGNS